MKNQYFGDINDYRKYGLLRILAGDGSLKVGVCWMLTHDDGGGDGSRTRYLQDPGQWREFDKGCLISWVRPSEEMTGMLTAPKLPGLFLEPGTTRLILTNILRLSIERREGKEG